MQHMRSIKEPASGSFKGRLRDFSNLLKEMLARRSGYLCSNPTCRTSKSGPREDTRWNMGIAAQVCTAIAGGPPYRDTLTPGQRLAITNGVEEEIGTLMASFRYLLQQAQFR
jgi:hypothetical protein